MKDKEDKFAQMERAWQHLAKRGNPPMRTPEEGRDEWIKMLKAAMKKTEKTIQKLLKEQEEKKENDVQGK